VFGSNANEIPQTSKVQLKTESNEDEEEKKYKSIE